jgi:hypothetical protein
MLTSNTRINGPNATLKDVFIDEFLESRGHTRPSVRLLVEADGAALLKAATACATLRLAEFEARAHYIDEIHRAREKQIPVRQVVKEHIVMSTPPTTGDQPLRDAVARKPFVVSEIEVGMAQARSDLDIAKGTCGGCKATTPCRKASLHEPRRVRER